MEGRRYGQYGQVDARERCAISVDDVKARLTLLALLFVHGKTGTRGSHDFFGEWRPECFFT